MIEDSGGIGCYVDGYSGLMVEELTVLKSQKKSIPGRESHTEH